MSAHTHIDWDALETLAAVAREGSFSAAAQQLGVRHTTVSRRIAAFEDRVGHSLLVRGARLAPTHLGAELLARIRPMERASAEVDAALRRRTADAAASLVLTTNGALAGLALAGLARLDPRPRVALRLSDEELPLERGVTDFALRPSVEPGRELRGTRVGRLRVAAYVARSAPRSDRHVLPSESLRARVSMRWWRALPRDAVSELTCDSLESMRDACAQGFGIALLPCFLARDDARLVELHEVELGPPLWLLAPARRRKDGAAASFARGLVGALRSLPGVFVDGPALR